MEQGWNGSHSYPKLFFCDDGAMKPNFIHFIGGRGRYGPASSRRTEASSGQVPDYYQISRSHAGKPGSCAIDSV